VPVTVTVTAPQPTRPIESVTVNVTGSVPVVVYTWLVVAPVPLLPSPKFHKYVAVPAAPLTLELKLTGVLADTLVPLAITFTVIGFPAVGVQLPAVPSAAGDGRRGRRAAAIAA